MIILSSSSIIVGMKAMLSCFWVFCVLSTGLFVVFGADPRVYNIQPKAPIKTSTGSSMNTSDLLRLRFTCLGTKCTWITYSVGFLDKL